MHMSSNFVVAQQRIVEHSGHRSQPEQEHQSCEVQQPPKHGGGGEARSFASQFLRENLKGRTHDRKKVFHEQSEANQKFQQAGGPDVVQNRLRGEAATTSHRSGWTSFGIPPSRLEKRSRHSSSCHQCTRRFGCGIRTVVGSSHLQIRLLDSTYVHHSQSRFIFICTSREAKISSHI